MAQNHSVDTSVFLRLFISKPVDHSRRVRSLIERLLDAGDSLFVPITVVAETCFYLNRRIGADREKVATSILELMRVDAFSFELEDVTRDALIFWRDHGGVSFLDCYHLARTRALGLPGIYAFDKKMDRYPGVERVEP